MSAFSVAVLPAPGPIGALTVGVSDEGLALVCWGADHELPQRAADRLDLRLDDDPERTAPSVEQLTQYFAGTRRVFDVPLDWRLTHEGAQRRVLQVLFETVPFGDVATYGRLGTRARLDSPRGVGTIMGSNPIPVVVPCHRVLAADGFGGFGGGLRSKEWLLAHEGSMTPALDLGLPGID